jgi:hypothetical protein
MSSEVRGSYLTLLIFAAPIVLGCASKCPHGASTPVVAGVPTPTASPSQSSSLPQANAPPVVDQKPEGTTEAIQSAGDDPAVLRTAVTETFSAIADERAEERIAGWTARKAQYKPPGDAFPQVIQSKDFDALLSIEALYSAVRNISNDPKNWQLLDPSQPLHFSVTDQQVVISGSHNSVAIIPRDQSVSIGKRTFRNSATVTLFRAVHRLLFDLSSEFHPNGVLGSQLATRGYRRSTTIEFSFGPLVVELGADHNGPGNPERLYVLDLIRVKDSLNWSSVKSSSSDGAFRSP